MNIYMKHDMEDMIEEIKENRAKAIAKIEMWEQVEILKKKNGEEFKELTAKCILNAYGDKIPLFPTDNANGYVISSPRIRVHAYADGYGWVEDSIYVTDEWKEGMDEDRRVKVYMRVPFLFNTAQEIREKISDRIKQLNDYVRMCDEAMEILPSVYTRFYAECKAAREHLEENGNSVINNLFYDVVRM